jgi:hypothetical protein
MSLFFIALVGVVAIGWFIAVVGWVGFAIDDARRNRRRQRALDSFFTREDQ